MSSTSSKLDPKNPDFWNKRWERNEIGWDKGKGHPVLKYLVSQQNIFYHKSQDSNKSEDQLNDLKNLLAKETQNIRLALVPGCGSGYDVEVLSHLDSIEKAIGVDLSEIAKEKAEETYAELVKSGKGQFIVADFFKLDKEYGGQIDFVWDYTFLCALHPSMRKDWALEMSKLVKKGGFILTMIFPLEQINPNPDLPPFIINMGIVSELLKDDFELVYDEKVASEDNHQEREGKEWYALWRRV